MKGKRGMCFLSLCLAVLLLACEGAEPALDASMARSNGESEEATVDSLAIKAKQAILAYPALTDANCEEFLLTWAAEHPEHRFELATSKGDMLLETFDDVPLHSACLLYTSPSPRDS